ncbi:cell division cycle protein-like protein 23 [Xylaria telfairii]|nr:cell division cycle protein-like protein 23 [Xylaria telfairii]
MSLSPEQRLGLKRMLQHAVLACSERCLYHSARWAAEHLAALPNDDNDPTVNYPAYLLLQPKRNRAELLLEQEETPKYLMAKALFDCHEFQRCADTLLPTVVSGHSTMFRSDKPVSWRRHGRVPREPISQRGLFLALYALLIVGEKQKMEEAGPVLGPSDTGLVTNKQLMTVRSIAENFLLRQDRHPENGPGEGWLEYLYAMILEKQGNRDLATTWIVKSVQLNPWNWGAWQELCGLLDEICAQLQPSIMAYMFSICARQEVHLPTPQLLSDISKMRIIFPGSLFVQGQEALVYHHMNDFASARSIFAEMLLSNPRYFDFLENYAHVLYNLDSRSALAFAAQIASSVEPFRPETCCAIGYFYSMSSRHEDSITYFRRAVTLDRNCTPAWTYLGHKYMDMGNFYAALSSYHRSIGLSKRDYKVFYGLGKAYEALQKPKMALDYYRQAVVLRPKEMGLWRALGNCMAMLSKFPQAIAALKKAIECTDVAFNKPEEYTGDIILLRLQRIHMLFQSALLYEDDRNRQEAKVRLRQCLDEATKHFAITPVKDEGYNEYISLLVPRSQLLLARWALDDGERDKARDLASQVEESSKLGKEAKAFVKEAKKLLDECDAEEEEY